MSNPSPDLVDLPPPWFHRLQSTAADGTPETLLVLYLDDRHPDTAVIDHPGPEAEVLADPSVSGYVRFRAPGGHIRVTEAKIPDGAAGGIVAGAPELCYVVVGEPEASPPAVQLIAFSGPAPDGAVLSPDQATQLRLRSEQQVAAVRWFPGSGVVHQVYVAPEWRRRRVASKLLTAAELVGRAHGWQPVHGSGERTALGEELVMHAPGYWRSRVVPQTTVMPPMTPGD